MARCAEYVQNLAAMRMFMQVGGTPPAVCETVGSGLSGSNPVHRHQGLGRHGLAEEVSELGHDLGGGVGLPGQHDR